MSRTGSSRRACCAATTDYTGLAQAPFSAAALTPGVHKLVASFAGDKRWKAIIEYRTDEGTKSIEHFFEEISDLHLIIEHGPDWNFLIRCTVTLNRHDDGEEQNSVEKALRQERSN